MGKLFIDTANLSDIEKVLKRGICDGVTTNPTLVGKEERAGGCIYDAYLNHMGSIVELFGKYNVTPSLSVEVFDLDPEKMIEQALQLDIDLVYDELAIKIPISYRKKRTDYLEVIKKLSDEMVPVNCTCCFDEGQLELAAKAGAKFVSLFYNRLINYHEGKYGNDFLTEEEMRNRPILSGSHGRAEVKALESVTKAKRFLNSSGLESEIILGSIREPFDITKGWDAGAHIVTAGYHVIDKMLYHPGSDTSVRDFDNDFKKWAKGEK